MTGKEWLIVVIVLAAVVGVGVPLIESMVRARDFRAQVNGRKPVRRLDERQEKVPNEVPKKQLGSESEKYIAELKSKQNLLGPK